MRYLQLAASVLLTCWTLPALADEASKVAPQPSEVIVKKLLDTSRTSAGDAIIFPQGELHVVVSIYDIPAFATLPIHKHPYPRYGYVLSGTLQVVNVETGHAEVFKANDLILEGVDHWHKASSVGPEPVKLLVIDYLKAGETSNIQLGK